MFSNSVVVVKFGKIGRSRLRSSLLDDRGFRGALTKSLSRTHPCPYREGWLGRLQQQQDVAPKQNLPQSPFLAQEGKGGGLVWSKPQGTTIWWWWCMLIPSLSLPKGGGKGTPRLHWDVSVQWSLEAQSQAGVFSRRGRKTPGHGGGKVLGKCLIRKTSDLELKNSLRRISQWSSSAYKTPVSICGDRIARAGSISSQIWHSLWRF
jgi:hypothetical protein